MAQLSNSELLTLYVSFKEDARGWLALHRQHFTQFVAIVLAVLGAAVAAYIKLKGDNGGEQVPCILVIGPILTIFLSILAVLVCNKFYKRYCEHDAIGYKLYRLIESRSDMKTDLKTVDYVYPEADDLFPERWTDRLNDAKTVDQYAKKHVCSPKASNFCIMLTFAGLIAISVVVMIVIISE